MRTARLSDTGSHGGEIITGSPTMTLDGLPVARIDDTYACPIHGNNPIVTGSPTMTLDGKKVARIGDSTACGATITIGSHTKDLD